MNKVARSVTPAVLTLLLLTGCAAHDNQQQARAGAAAPSLVADTGGLPVDDPHSPMPAPGTCHLGNRDGQPLPDPHCTPGAVNPNVHQDNITSTICKAGWSATVRPPVSKTNPMKAASARSYSLGASQDGEYDHLVSIELGGGPDDPRNLWVEPGKIPNPKDAVENKLNEAVCSGLVPLTTAQQAIAHSWVTAYDDAGLAITGGKVCLRNNPTRCATSRHGN